MHEPREEALDRPAALGAAQWSSVLRRLLLRSVGRDELGPELALDFGRVAVVGAVADQALGDFLDEAGVERLDDERALRSLTPSVFATSPTDVRMASRSIVTICSSVNLLLRIVLSRSGGEPILSCSQWSEHPSAGPSDRSSRTYALTGHELRSRLRILTLHCLGNPLTHRLLDVPPSCPRRRGARRSVEVRAMVRPLVFGGLVWASACHGADASRPVDAGDSDAGDAASLAGDAGDANVDVPVLPLDVGLDSALDDACVDAASCIEFDAGDPDAGLGDASVVDAGDDAEVDAAVSDDAGEVDGAVPLDGSVPFDAASCTYRISPTSRVITDACGMTTGTLTVTVTAGCSWSVRADNGTSATNWLRILAGGGPNVGTGSGQSVTYTVASNRHQDARSGAVLVVDPMATETGATAMLSQVAGHACP